VDRSDEDLACIKSGILTRAVVVHSSHQLRDPADADTQAQTDLRSFCRSRETRVVFTPVLAKLRSLLKVALSHWYCVLDVSGAISA
jgi:hypothetical protein